MEMNKIAVEQMDESIDLKQYFWLFWHWLWLIILAGIVAGITSYFISVRMTPFYGSSTTLLVNEAPATKGADYNSALLSQKLTSTYALMMVQDPILKQVADQVGLANPLEDLQEWITITPIRDTQLIEVSVETTNPELSAKIANSIANVFALQIQSIQSERFSFSKANLETQLSDTEKQISVYSAQSDLATNPNEKDRLEEKVTQYRQIYANLLQSYEQVRLSEAQTVSTVIQVAPATPDLKPVRPKILQNTLLAAIVGMLLAAGSILFRYALDDTIKTPDTISRKFKLPILGVINHHSPEKDSPISLSDPRSPTAEAYRTLRTNVSYASVDKPLRTLLVTSTEPGEGKSTTISNLAVVLAQSGKRIILADCDLRHPRIHSYFGLNNNRGMSSLFAQTDVALGNSYQSTKEDSLLVITTGSLPPNPSELLGSQKMQSIIESMRKSADMILIDTPPILAVTDATSLAPSVDGVLLVVQPGKTRASALKQTLEQLHQVNARVLGFVLNDVVTKGKSYGYHYQNYRNYTVYQDHYGAKAKEKKKDKLS